MESVYKTGVINHIKSSRYILFNLFLVLLIFCLIVFIDKVDIYPDGLMIGILGVILVLIVDAPAVFLHISYYIKNFGLKIIINERKNTLIVSKSGKEQAYRFFDIIFVERHLAIYYKNRIDHLNRRGWSGTPYGYLLIKFNDGLEVYATSLMLDVFNPPILVNHTYFRCFPYMKSGLEFSKRRVVVKEHYENKISQYKSTFKHHSDRQLNEKILNEKTYDKAAVEAARRLLAIRSSMDS